MKLFYSPGACSLAAHIVSRETGIPLEMEAVDLQTKQTESGADFLAINPKGYVPALLTADDAVLTENVAILHYLASSASGHDLVPDQSDPRYYRLLEWLALINSEIHKAFAPLWNADNPPSLRQTARATVGKWFGFLDRHLSTQPYLMGDRFSLADAYCFTVVNWSGFLEIDLAPFPDLQRYQRAVAARPAVQSAMAAEGLLAAA